MSLSRRLDSAVIPSNSSSSILSQKLKIAIGSGHKNIVHTVRYTNLAPDRFKTFWRD